MTSVMQRQVLASSHKAKSPREDLKESLFLFRTPLGWRRAPKNPLQARGVIGWVVQSSTDRDDGLPAEIGYLDATRLVAAEDLSSSTAHAF